MHVPDMFQRQRENQIVIASRSYLVFGGAKYYELLKAIEIHMVAIKWTTYDNI